MLSASRAARNSASFSSGDSPFLAVDVEGNPQAVPALAERDVALEGFHESRLRDRGRPELAHERAHLGERVARQLLEPVEQRRHPLGVLREAHARGLGGEVHAEHGLRGRVVQLPGQGGALLGGRRLLGLAGVCAQAPVRLAELGRELVASRPGLFGPPRGPAVQPDDEAPRDVGRRVAGTFLHPIGEEQAEGRQHAERREPHDARPAGQVARGHDAQSDVEHRVVVGVGLRLEQREDHSRLEHEERVRPPRGTLPQDRLGDGEREEDRHEAVRERPGRAFAGGRRSMRTSTETYARK